MEGWHDTGVRATRRVGGKCRGGHNDVLKLYRSYFLSVWMQGPVFFVILGLDPRIQVYRLVAKATLIFVQFGIC